MHADKNKKELLSLYSYIRELINEREQQMILQIQSNLDKEEIECENRMSEIADFIQKINELKNEVSQ